MRSDDWNWNDHDDLPHGIIFWTAVTALVSIGLILLLA